MLFQKHVHLITVAKLRAGFRDVLDPVDAGVLQLWLNALRNAIFLHLCRQRTGAFIPHISCLSVLDISSMQFLAKVVCACFSFT